MQGILKGITAQRLIGVIGAIGVIGCADAFTKFPSTPIIPNIPTTKKLAFKQMVARLRLRQEQSELAHFALP